MAFSYNDKHCQECICRDCPFRADERCDEGKELCEKCRNDEHTSWCYFNEARG